jgi:hypothetical protein
MIICMNRVIHQQCSVYNMMILRLLVVRLIKISRYGTMPNYHNINARTRPPLYHSSIALHMHCSLLSHCHITHSSSCSSSLLLPHYNTSIIDRLLVIIFMLCTSCTIHLYDNPLHSCSLLTSFGVPFVHITVTCMITSCSKRSTHIIPFISLFIPYTINLRYYKI